MRKKKKVIDLFILRGEDESSCQLESDEEDLEQPLPLRSDDEWQHFGPFPPHHSCTHNCGKELSVNTNVTVET